MNIEQLRDAFRFVRRWNVERGYWSRVDAQEFESAIGEAVRSGDKDSLALYVTWLSDQRNQINDLTAMLAPLCRAMELRVMAEMRAARKVGSK